MLALLEVAGFKIVEFIVEFVSKLLFAPEMFEAFKLLASLEAFELAEVFDALEVFEFAEAPEAFETLGLKCPPPCEFVVFVSAKSRLESTRER